MSHFPYDLTIGMIVKNEIKYLRRCLETLKPLREALSCELIITDTGSTDGTKEIAQEFADVYLEFEWCNDFAKARNTGVERAQGRWFFYVDADNEFDESLLEIAHFLKRPQVDSAYDAASLIIRNYTDTEKNSYNDIVRSWILNFSKGKRFFQGAVHESVGVNQTKVCALSTVMHHWGYLPSVVDQKNHRNLPILRQMYAENPSDLKNRIQLAKEIGNPVEKQAFLEESIAYMLPLTKKSDDAKMWLMVLRNHYHQFALHQKDYALAHRLIKEWTTYLAGSIFEINFLGFCMEVYLNQGTQQQALLFETFPKFQAIFFKRRHPSDASFRLFDNFLYADDFHYYQAEFRTIHQAIEAGRFEEATLWTTSSKAHQFYLPNKKHKYLFDVTHLCFLLKEYDFLSTVYTYAVSHSTAKELEILLQEIEKQYHSFSKKEKQCFLRAFPHTCLHWYQALMKLRFYQNKLPLCPKEVQQRLKSTPHWEQRPLLAPLLYSYLLTGEDPISYLDHMPLTFLNALEQRLLSIEPDFDGVLLARLHALPHTAAMQALPLSHKQTLGHLGILSALRRHAKGEDTSSLLPLFWSAVSLLVFAVAERGTFTSSASHQGVEQAAVLLWQAQEDPASFAQATQQVLTLCPSLSPFLSLLAQTPPPSKEGIKLQKQQVKETIKALSQGNRHKEAYQLRTAFLTSYPEEFLPMPPSLSENAPPLSLLQEALSHSLALLHTPSAQAKQKLLTEQYQSLLSEENI